MKIDENLANISEILNRRRELQRSNSFSTATSSKAEAFVKQQYEDIAKLASFGDSVLALDSKSKAKLSNRDGVHVGDVIYVNYIIPNDATNCNNCTGNNNNNQKFERDNVSDSANSMFDTESNRLINNISNRKFIWICITCIFIALFVIIGVVITFLKLPENHEYPVGCIDCAENESSTSEKMSTILYETTLGIFLPELIVTRKTWDADPPKSSNISKLLSPIKRIIVGQTLGDNCFSKV